MSTKDNNKIKSSNDFHILLEVVFKPLKRLTGIILFLTGAAICGMTIFPFILIFFGIDKANNWMDKNILPFASWWD